MEKVILKTSHTETGYCCTCDLLPGWTVSGSKDLKDSKHTFKKVLISI